MVHTWDFPKLSLKHLSKILQVFILSLLLLKKVWITLRMKMGKLLEKNLLWMYFKISTQKVTWFYSKEEKVQLYAQKIRLQHLKVIVTPFSTFIKKVQKDLFLLIVHIFLTLGNKKKKLKLCNLNLSKAITTPIIKCVFGLKNLNLHIFSKMSLYLFHNQTLQELK